MSDPFKLLDECLQHALNTKQYKQMEELLKVRRNLEEIMQANQRLPSDKEFIESLIQYQLDDFTSAMLDVMTIDFNVPETAGLLNSAITFSHLKTVNKLIGLGCHANNETLSKCIFSPLPPQNLVDIIKAIHAKQGNGFINTPELNERIGYAFGANKAQVVECLIDLGAAITPDVLFLAAKNGNLNLFKKIIALGVDPNFTNAEGKNAMHYAIEGDALEVMFFLNKEYNIKPDANCLDVAEKNNAVRCGQMLIHSGFTVGYDALHNAFTLYNRNPDFIIMLLKNGIRPEDTTELFFRSLDNSLDELAAICLQLGAKKYHYENVFSKRGNRTTTVLAENKLRGEMPLTRECLALIDTYGEKWLEHIEEKAANKLSTNRKSLIWQAAKAAKVRMTGVDKVDEVLREASLFKKPTKGPNT